MAKIKPATECNYTTNDTCDYRDNHDTSPYQLLLPRLLYSTEAIRARLSLAHQSNLRYRRPLPPKRLNANSARDDR